MHSMIGTMSNRRTAVMTSEKLTKKQLKKQEKKRLKAEKRRTKINKARQKKVALEKSQREADLLRTTTNQHQTKFSQTNKNSVWQVAASGDVHRMENLVSAAFVLDANGQSPLHHASAKGRDDMVAFLLSLGQSSLNLQDKKGRTPLHLACSGMHETTVFLLIDAGANVGLADHDKKGALDVAAKKSKRFASAIEKKLKEKAIEEQKIRRQAEKERKEQLEALEAEEKKEMEALRKKAPPGKKPVKWDGQWVYIDKSIQDAAAEQAAAKQASMENLLSAAASSSSAGASYGIGGGISNPTASPPELRGASIGIGATIPQEANRSAAPGGGYINPILAPIASTQTQHPLMVASRNSTKAQQQYVQWGTRMLKMSSSQLSGIQSLSSSQLLENFYDKQNLSQLLENHSSSSHLSIESPFYRCDNEQSSESVFQTPDIFEPISHALNVFVNATSDGQFRQAPLHLKRLIAGLKECTYYALKIAGDPMVDNDAKKAAVAKEALHFQNAIQDNVEYIRSWSKPDAPSEEKIVHELMLRTQTLVYHAFQLRVISLRPFASIPLDDHLRQIAQTAKRIAAPSPGEQMGELIAFALMHTMQLEAATIEICIHCRDAGTIHSICSALLTSTTVISTLCNTQAKSNNAHLPVATQQKLLSTLGTYLRGVNQSVNQLLQNMSLSGYKDQTIAQYHSNAGQWIQHAVQQCSQMMKQLKLPTERSVFSLLLQEMMQSMNRVGEALMPGSASNQSKVLFELTQVSSYFAAALMQRVFQKQAQWQKEGSMKSMLYVRAVDILCFASGLIRVIQSALLSSTQIACTAILCYLVHLIVFICVNLSSHGELL